MTKTLKDEFFNIIERYNVRVGPRILSLESVDYFGTSDYVSGRKKNNLNEQNFDGGANWSGVVNFHSVHCVQMSLVMSMRFIFGHD